MSIRNLKEVADISMGQAPDGSSYNFDTNGYPLIAGAGDFGSDTPSPKKFTTLPTRISKRGDIILCIRATIGDLNWSDRDYCLGRGVAGIRPHPTQVDPKYLWFALQSQKAALESQGTGSTFKQVSRSDVESLKIFVPSLSEQRRIVAILDKADAIRRKRRQAIDLMNDFLRSVFLEMFGDPIANPKQLDVRKLGEIVQLVSGGTPSKSNPAFWDGNVPWVSPKDMKRFWLSDSEDHVSSSVPEETNLKMIAEKTVLIVVRGMILVHTVPICMTRVPVTINQDIKALLPTTKINSVYLAWALLVQHDSILGKVSTASHGTKRLETDVLLATPITIPPLKSQQQFEVIVERYREMYERVANQSRLDGELFNSLSHSLLEAGETSA